jgi:hypothetical protein
MTEPQMGQPMSTPMPKPLEKDESFREALLSERDAAQQARTRHHEELEQATGFHNREIDRQTRIIAACNAGLEHLGLDSAPKPAADGSFQVAPGFPSNPQ